LSSAGTSGRNCGRGRKTQLKGRKTRFESIVEHPTTWMWIMTLHVGNNPGIGSNLESSWESTVRDCLAFPGIPSDDRFRERITSPKAATGLVLGMVSRRRARPWFLLDLIERSIYYCLAPFVMLSQPREQAEKAVLQASSPKVCCGLKDQCICSVIPETSRTKPYITRLNIGISLCNRIAS
jgi:hypothetical protein